MPVPMAMSVNMLRLRLTIDAQPRWKNGQPPQRTTGVARANSIQASSLGDKACTRECRPSMADMAMTISGAVSARLIQNRRAMRRSSGLASSSGVTVRGSSAMPHLGHAPGPRWRTSGSIGQV